MRHRNRADAVIIGSGLNSMVAGALLAKAGWSVAVFERSSHLGGAVRTAEITLPGFKHDVFSGWHLLFTGSEAYRLLKPDLDTAGLVYLNHPVSAATVTHAGKVSVLARTQDANAVELNRIMPGDGEGWRRASADFDAHAQIVQGVLNTELWSGAGLALAIRAYRQMHARGLVEFMAETVSTAREWLERDFASDTSRALFAPWVLHTGLGPEDALSGLMLKVMSVMLERVGMPIPQGGGGKLIEALTAVIRRYGGVVESDADVVQIETARGEATAVFLADGRRISARRAVLANVTPTQLYHRLLPHAALPPAFRKVADRYRYGRADMQVHFALKQRPRWIDDERLNNSPVINLSDGVDAVSRAVNEARRGLIPADPTLCVGQPVLIDPSRAPEGAWTLWIQMLEMPNPLRGDALGELEVSDGVWTREVREAVADRVQRRIGRHIERFDEIILARTTLSPADLEHENINLVGGDPYSGELDLEQNLLFRPLSAEAPHQTPIRRLYQIGASTYPGPGLSGASGTLVAKALITRHRGVSGLIDALTPRPRPDPHVRSAAPAAGGGAQSLPSLPQPPQRRHFAMTTLTEPPAHSKSKLSIAGDAILLLADLQAGIADLPLTVPQAMLKKHVGALIRLAAIFEIPTLITVVPGADGRPSALMDEVEAVRANARYLVRTTPNSFNDAEIRRMIESSGRRTLLVSGVATEVAVQLPSLTAAAEGYDVHVIVDACGGISPRTEDAALRRLTQAGAHITSLPTLVGELAGDFTQPKGQQAIGVLFELAGG